jgi:protein-disulfide isomerase
MHRSRTDMQHSDKKADQQTHVRGPENAPLTVVEYGDFQCPYCARAHQVLGELAPEFGGIRLEFRHLPLSDLHPLAELAAEAAEAAAAQGRFWEMHDALYENQDDVTDPQDLAALAESLDLDLARFGEDAQAHRYRERVRADLERARDDGAHRTPTFIINGKPYHGDSDRESLAQAFSEALGR